MIFDIIYIYIYIYTCRYHIIYTHTLCALRPAPEGAPGRQARPGCRPRREPGARRCSGQAGSQAAPLVAVVQARPRRGGGTTNNIT